MREKIETTEWEEGDEGIKPILEAENRRRRRRREGIRRRMTGEKKKKKSWWMTQGLLGLVMTEDFFGGILSHQIQLCDTGNVTRFVFRLRFLIDGKTSEIFNCSFFGKLYKITLKTYSTPTLDFSFHANLNKTGLYSIVIPYVKHSARTFNPRVAYRFEPTTFRQQRQAPSLMWRFNTKLGVNTIQKDFVRRKTSQKT